METVWMLVRALLMTAVVAGLAYLTAALVRQRAVRMRRGAYLELVDALSLGGRHHLVLVRAGGRVVCIGVSPEGLSTVTEFDGDDAQRLLAGGPGEPSGTEAGAGGGFAGRFRRLLERGPGAGDGRERG